MSMAGRGLGLGSYGVFYGGGVRRICSSYKSSEDARCDMAKKRIV